MGERGRNRMVTTRAPQMLVENTLQAYRAAGWKVST